MAFTLIKPKFSPTHQTTKGLAPFNGSVKMAHIPNNIHRLGPAKSLFFWDCAVEPAQRALIRAIEEDLANPPQWQRRSKQSWRLSKRKSEYEKLQQLENSSNGRKKGRNGNSLNGLKKAFGFES